VDVPDWGEADVRRVVDEALAEGRVDDQPAAEAAQ
jgi:hypothetical protein